MKIAMKVMGRQFCYGETYRDAVKEREKKKLKVMSIPHDMLAWRRQNKLKMQTVMTRLM